MLFPAGNIGDLQFRILLIRPELNEERSRTIEITHRLDTIIGEGRTTIEERRAGRAGLLLTQRCTLPLKGNAADDWRKGIASLGSRLVAMPLWIDALPPARWAERIYEPLQVINFDPVTGVFVIYEAGDVPGAFPHPLLAPLLVGRWRERPAANATTKKFGDVEVSITEASPWSCRIGINTQAGGWSALPDRASGPTKDRSDFGLELLELGGAVREPGLDRENAAARWTQEGAFTFRTREEIRQHLSHFVARAGARDAWAPVPAFFQPGVDTGDTPDSYTARFASDSLALTYISGAVARATVGFVQEVNTGARSQSLPSETYLYTWTYQHDAANPERYTNWDAPIDGVEGTFQPKQCAHKELLLSLRPQDVKAEIEIAHVPGTLAADWLIARLFGRVGLRVEKCDPEDVAATRKIIFDGFVRSVLPNGNTLQVTATLFGQTLDRRVPSDVFSRRCNAFVFDARCGLVEADHDSAGTIEPADISADGFTVTVHAPSGWGDGGTGTYADNWFGPNGVFRMGLGRATQVATIVSSVMAGAALVLKLNRPIFADQVDALGEIVQLVPGCGGQLDADCTTKFDNAINHRGFPFMPDYIEQNSTGGMPKGKK